MSESPMKPREEKDEKQHEKEEKGRSDPLSTIVWGAIFIWAGLVLLADNLGYLSGFGLRGDTVPGAFPFRISTWGLVFAGAGVIILLEVVVRLVMPEYRRHVVGSIITGFVFIGIGLGNLISWNVIGALVLIAIGIVILLRALGWKI
ncbi:MAG: hypothetical protein HZB51_11355 [Chloroflexi bacterium]|nr:hypothetical protein [Chloroflexota bacterium]